MLQSLKKKIFKGKNELIFKTNPISFQKNISYNSLKEYTNFENKNSYLDAQPNQIKTFQIFDKICKTSDSLFFETANLKCSLFNVFAQLIGREFNKTVPFKVNYKQETQNSIFEVLEGSGYFILENLNLFSEIKLIKVSKNSQVFIPKNYSLTIINSSLTDNLICIALCGKNSKFEKVNYKKNFGSAIFYTKKGFIKNQNFNFFKLDEIEGDYLEDFYFNKEKGIYKEFTDLPEKFNFLKE